MTRRTIRPSAPSSQEIVSLLAAGRYGQTNARFYRSTYESWQEYLAIDKELSPLDVFAGPTCAYARSNLGPFALLRIDARVKGFAFRYFDFPRLGHRRGLTMELAIRAEL